MARTRATKLASTMIMVATIAATRALHPINMAKVRREAFLATISTVDLHRASNPVVIKLTLNTINNNSTVSHKGNRMDNSRAEVTQAKAPTTPATKAGGSKSATCYDISNHARS